MDMFKNRQEAGLKLAQKLDYLRGQKILVLAIPRGGVVVGKEISQELNCPLGILIVKKIGAPANPELAVGAMGPDGEVVLNKEILQELGIEEKDFEEIKKLKKEEITRLSRRLAITTPALRNKIVILTDDGIATGATTEAALSWLRKKNPEKIILAVPVAPVELIEKFKGQVDDLIVLEIPAYFRAVGQFYEDFPQVSDEEVVKLLNGGQE